jgi:DHA1 family bicyclomycin/chloramphenicol resistance-like MFS transporter
MAYTVSGFLVGLSLGQLVWGPISDRYGRRVPVAMGISLFILGSAGCALAGSADAIIAARLVQAFGASAAVVLARAMVRDLHDGDEAARMLSTLMTVMAIAPLVGPILGGQILAVAGWRAIFWTLVGIGILALVALRALPETLPSDRRAGTSLIQVFTTYGTLAADRRLLAFAGVCGSFFAGTFAYIAGSPFAYIAYYHVPSAAYGLLIATGIIGMMAMNYLNGRFVGRFGLRKMLRGGACVAAIAGITVAIDARTGWGGIAGLAVPLFLFVSMTGVVVANSVAGALSAYPNRAGAVSALLGALQYGGGVAGSALTGALGDGMPFSMGLMVAIGGVGCLASAMAL